MILSTRMIELIERKAPALGARWSKVVLENPLTTSYRRLSEVELGRRAENVYASLGHWLDHRISREEAKDRYFQLGRRRCAEGFELLELVVALSLEKTILMEVLEEESLFSDALQMHGVFELMVMMMDFFDRALVYTIQGYQTECATVEPGDRRPPEPRDSPRRIRPTQTWFAISDLKDK
ncbi:hypothetical protein KKD52_10040 [Myxococcota bacterium]|nr:hypothetical protein [Myxococcota bacterium]MBU1241749.1 hypothetical protein [Myxococcota bacterium]MBU1510688.1 hypothetical protein [Myxococcota bacterium]